MENVRKAINLDEGYIIKFHISWTFETLAKSESLISSLMHIIKYVASWIFLSRNGFWFIISFSPLVHNSHWGRYLMWELRLHLRFFWLFLSRFYGDIYVTKQGVISAMFFFHS